MRLLFALILSALFSLGYQSTDKISVSQQDFRKASIPPSLTILGESPMFIELKEATFYPHDSTLTMRGILRDDATKICLKDGYGYILIYQDTTKDFSQQIDSSGSFSLKIKVEPNKKLTFEYLGQKPIIYDLNKLLSIVLSKSSSNNR